MPVGSRYRAGFELPHVTEIPGGFQVLLNVKVEVEGAQKPSLVAECLIRYYA